MSHVEDLKHEAYRLARAANDLAQRIDSYTRVTDDILHESMEVLESSATGVDKRVAASLRTTSQSIKNTRNLLYQIGDEASNYARRI